MTRTEQPQQEPRSPVGRAKIVGWPLALVLVVALTVLAWWLFLRAVPALPTLDAASKAAASIARAYREGTLTTEFTAYTTDIQGSQRLQVATLESVEVISRRDQASVLWGQMELPEVVVRASLPTTYTYYLDLNEPWQLDWDDQTNVLQVLTPPLRWNSPAVDLSTMRLEVEQGSPLRDEAAAQERLRSTITPWLEKRAAKNRALVEATAREEVEAWVRSWVQAEFGLVGEIQVAIADSPAPATNSKPNLGSRG